MSKAAKQRRFLKWRKYRQQCTELTGQSVPLTRGMATAWVRGFHRVSGGFFAVPPWNIPYDIPIGSWQNRKWRSDED